MNDFRFRMNWKNEQNDQLEADKSLLEVTKNMMDIYADRIHKFRNVFSTFHMFYFPVSFVLIILGAIRYLRKYLNKDHYKNYVMGRLPVYVFFLLIILKIE